MSQKTTQFEWTGEAEKLSKFSQYVSGPCKVSVRCTYTGIGFSPPANVATALTDANGQHYVVFLVPGSPDGKAVRVELTMETETLSCDFIGMPFRRM